MFAGPCELLGYNDSCCPDGADCQGILPDGICHCSIDCHMHRDCCVDTAQSCRCRDGDLSLVDGNKVNEGRLEICFDNEWGTICDDYWGTQEARVACRQLGLPFQGNIVPCMCAALHEVYHLYYFRS